MYHEKFTISVLAARENRLTLEITILEKRIEEKKVLRDKVLFAKLAQEYKLHLLINQVN